MAAPGLASRFHVEWFQQTAEAFARARARRAWQLEAGHAAGLDLGPLYEGDFPSFTSYELYADLHEAPMEDPRQKRALQAFLASALAEGRTLAYAERAAAFETRTTVAAGGEEIPWRAAPRRWTLARETARRHKLNAAWREAIRRGLGSTLQRWQEALREPAERLDGAGWLPLWAELHGLDLPRVAALAEQLLAASAETYRDTLQVYLAQRNLPPGDAWAADADWAFRADHLDPLFPTARTLIPTMVRTLRPLGFELEDQPAISFDLAEQPARAPGIRCLATDVPREARVVGQLVGGFHDYRRLLEALGQAQHVAHTDPSLPFAARWLGDPATPLGYGYLLGNLALQPTWLRDHLALGATEDYLAIGHLAWLYRLRRAAAAVLQEIRRWEAEPGEGVAGDWAEAMSDALHVRHFPEESLLALRDAPWRTLAAASRLRAEVFAAQVRAYLRREFDEEWHRSRRAGRFLVDELWRPGRRYTAEEVLGFMGYDGLDPMAVWGELADALGKV